jgi:hypothetical protein
MAKPSNQDEQLSEEEIAQRRDEALLRALNTPHKPQKPTKDSAKSPAKRGRPKKDKGK